MTYGMTNEGFRPGARPAAPAPGAAGAPGARPAAGAPAARPAGGMAGMLNNGFEEVLVDELIPYIDANFRTLANQANRAMAGLSMGGMETRAITMSRPEVFSHFGLMSGGTYSVEDIKNKSSVKLIFMSAGSFENPDGVRKAADNLKAAGFNAVSYVSEGTRHEFQTWRRSLYEMAQLLFK